MLSSSYLITNSSVVSKWCSLLPCSAWTDSRPSVWNCRQDILSFLQHGHSGASHFTEKGGERWEGAAVVFLICVLYSDSKQGLLAKLITIVKYFQLWWSVKWIWGEEGARWEKWSVQTMQSRSPLLSSNIRKAIWLCFWKMFTSSQQLISNYFCNCIFLTGKEIIPQFPMYPLNA